MQAASPLLTAAQERIVASVRAANVTASPYSEQDYRYIRTLDVSPHQYVRFDQFFPRVQDQLSFGICTGETISTLCEAVRAVRYGYTAGVDELSERFPYYVARHEFDLLGDGDVGATPRGIFEAARRRGMIPESLLPFGGPVDEIPTTAMYMVGAQNKLLRYYVLPINKDNPAETVKDIESVYAEGKVAAYAFHCPRWVTRVSGALGSAGHLQGPNNDPQNSGDNEIIGGHICPICGYDRRLHGSSGGAIVVQNSWGLNWGDQGLWSLNYVDMVRYGMEIRVMDGYGDVALGGGAPARIITEGEINRVRSALIAANMGTLTGGQWIWTADPTLLCQFATYEALRGAGYTHAEMAIILSIPAASIDAFATNDDHQARLAGMRSVMRDQVAGMG